MTATDPPDRASPAARCFRLLIPCDAAVPAGRPSIEIAGRRWCLTELSDVPVDVAYTCVSYSWGAGRTTHPFDDRVQMSDQVMAVLETAVGVVEPEALWVDAYCMPLTQPARDECLRRMGEIYGRARQLIIVLSAHCTEALRQIAESGAVDEAALLAFGRDEWVSRAWTYQELVNGKEVHVVAQGSAHGPVNVEDVLHAMTYAIDDYKKAQGLDSFQMAVQHARLNDFENLVVDWKIAGYLERSAYQVMVAMHLRETVAPEDRIAAMLGSLSHVTAQHASSLGEQFMQTCEANGDYSYIYCTSPRADTPGRRWRPLACDRFEAIVPWPSWGDGQPGSLHPTHLRLDGMCRIAPSRLTDAGREEVQRWAPGEHASTADLAASLVARLRMIGYSGCGQYLETSLGLFILQSAIVPRDGLYLAVTTGVRMTLGSPGLLLEPGLGGIDICRDVGILVGLSATANTSINVG